MWSHGMAAMALAIAMTMATFLATFVAGSSSGVQHGNGKAFGYLPEWRHRFLDEDHAHRLRDICKALSHLILFSLEVGPGGELTELDRFPTQDRLALLRRECQTGLGVKLMLCLGGNSRSGAFSNVSRNKALREKFSDNLVLFLKENSLDGVDWNWEYPTGMEDWAGLAALMDATHAASKAQGIAMTMSMAYYPDTQQEKVIKGLSLDTKIDWLHSMAYDAPGEHSTLHFAEQTLQQYSEAGLPMGKLTLGLPLYARSTRSGEWKSYHDVVQDVAGSDAALAASTNLLQGEWFYNSPTMIATKVRLAFDSGAAGVMIWESGQDTVDATLHNTIAATHHALLSPIERKEL